MRNKREEQVSHSNQHSNKQKFHSNHFTDRALLQLIGILMRRCCYCVNALWKGLAIGFVDEVTCSRRAAPSYFAYMVILNHLFVGGNQNAMFSKHDKQEQHSYCIFYYANEKLAYKLKQCTDK